MPAPISADYDKLTHALEGEFHTGRTVRLLYATDASEYQELPAAVALPRSEADVRQLLAFAREHGIGLIPRAAGTSLAGQVVGSGIVVDLGRHLDRILAIDPVRRRARVQPGVIRNELNLALQPHGLLFGPETSTANRAMCRVCSQFLAPSSIPGRICAWISIMVSTTFSSPNRSSMAIWAILHGNLGHWGVALWHPAPKDCGAPQRSCLSAFVEAPRTIFCQNTIRFCLEMTFPGNLSLPVILLGAFEGRHASQIERYTD